MRSTGPATSWARRERHRSGSHAALLWVTATMLIMPVGSTVAGLMGPSVFAGGAAAPFSPRPGLRGQRTAGPMEPHEPRKASGARVAAVVASYHAPDGVLACIRTLLAQTHPELAVLVVDNGSTPDEL